MKALKTFIKPFDTQKANQWNGFYMKATLVFNGLKYLKHSWSVNSDKVFSFKKLTFVFGRMTQYMLIIVCIFIGVPQQKRIVLIKIKIYREKKGCLQLKTEN